MKRAYISLLVPLAACLIPSLVYSQETSVPPARSIPLTFFPADDTNAEFVAQTPTLSAKINSRQASLHFRGSAITLRMIGLTAEPAIEPQNLLDARANYLVGAQHEWRTNVRLYGKVRISNVYRGIDVVYSGSERRLKSEYVVHPGGDPTHIAVQYDGAESVRIDIDGSLVVTTAAGEMREQVPEIFQGTPEGRKKIAGSYRQLTPMVIGFDVDEYDRSETLIIDPTITYSTFLGGSGLDYTTGIAVDATGNAYITGYTDSIDFPAGTGYRVATGGGVDAFVVKLNPAGDTLLYATYLGGRGDDRGLSIAVAADGTAAVAGYTSSTNFPAVAAYKRTLAGGRDAFVTKLNATGSALVFSTYLGGTANDSANGAAVDGSGDIYIAGDTSSANFPVLNAYQAASRGRQEAFFAKLSSSGALQFSTYYGGSGDDRAAAIAVDPSRAIYIGGSTTSLNLPTASPFQATNRGGQDGFIAKFAASGSSLVYASYLGGSKGAVGAAEQINAIAVDANGNATVAGVASSLNFPSVSPSQTAHGGGTTDGFVTRLSSSGQSLIFSTYLGGLGQDSVNAVAVDSGGGIFVAGSTAASTFSTSFNAVQPVLGGSYDAFVVNYTTAGVVQFSTFYGGTGSETASAIAVDSNGNAWLAGFSTSPELPGVAGVQSMGSADGNGFVSKFYIGGNRPPVTVSASPTTSVALRQVLTAVVSDPDGAGDVTDIRILVHTTSTPGNQTCSILYKRAQNQLFLYSDTSVQEGPILLGSASTLQNSQCTVYAATSTVTLSASDITLKVDIGRSANYYGNKNVYLQVADSRGASSPWDLRATWNVDPIPVPVAVSTNTGAGMTKTFTFRTTLSTGYQNVYTTQVIIDSAVRVANTCYITHTGGYVMLRNDAGNAWLGPIIVGQGTSLSNNQCTISNPTTTGSGDTFDLVVPVTFKSTYQGARKLNQLVSSTTGANSGWVVVGTWTVQP